MHSFKLLDKGARTGSSWTRISSFDWLLPEEVSEEKKAVFRPLFGQTVACGLFGISDDYIQQYQTLDERFIQNRSSTYFFVARGDSMSPLILEKDILIVDRSIEPSHNRVVVVSIDGEMYCKRLIKESDKMVLRSDNSTYSDILMSGEMDIIFFGVVTGLCRYLYN